MKTVIGLMLTLMLSTLRAETKEYECLEKLNAEVLELLQKHQSLLADQYTLTTLKVALMVMEDNKKTLEDYARSQPVVSKEYEELKTKVERDPEAQKNLAELTKLYQQYQSFGDKKTVLDLTHSIDEMLKASDHFQTRAIYHQASRRFYGQKTSEFLLTQKMLNAKNQLDERDLAITWLSEYVGERTAQETGRYGMQHNLTNLSNRVARVTGHISGTPASPNEIREQISSLNVQMQADLTQLFQSAIDKFQQDPSCLEIIGVTLNCKGQWAFMNESFVKALGQISQLMTAETQQQMMRVSTPVEREVQLLLELTLKIPAKEVGITVVPPIRPVPHVQLNKVPALGLERVVQTRGPSRITLREISSLGAFEVDDEVAPGPRDRTWPSVSQIDFNRELPPDECFSGERLGVQTVYRTEAENEEKGLQWSNRVTSLVDGKTYFKTINGVRKEVTDNLFYDQLLQADPTLSSPRVDGFTLTQRIPEIPNFTYQREEYFDRLITPERTWAFNFFGRNGNQRLLVTDSPLRVHRNSQGKVIRTEALSDPAIRKSFEFFPRRQVASVEKARLGEQEVMRMTLPNGATVDYHGETGELLGGAFRSTPRTRQEYIRGHNMYNPTKYDYVGPGVWIEMEETNANGDTRRELNSQGRPNQVKVFKNNGDGTRRECSLPSALLWETKTGHRSLVEEAQAFRRAQGEDNPSPWAHMNTGYTCFHLRYKTDEEIDRLFRARCGFGFMEH
jgi:hypothetical protein